MKKWLRSINACLDKLLTSPTSTAVGLIASITTFLALTLTRLTSSSIWFDEGFSTVISRQSFGDIFHYTAADVHPPLYYWLLKIWTSLFGTSDAAFRSMSVVFGVIALVLVFILVKKLFSRQTVVLSTFLVAISPMFVRYGIEARMYMVVVVICLAATLMLLRALRTNKQHDYLIYGVLLALGMWTHYFTAVVWLAHWVYRLTYLKSNGVKKKDLRAAFFTRNWIVAHITAVVLFLPWIPSVIRQMSGLAGGFWIPPVTLNTAGDLVGEILFYLEGSRTDGWIAVTGLAVISVIIYMLYRLWPCLPKTDKLNLQLVLIIALAPIAFLVILSLYPFKSVFVDRYLMTSIVFIYILLAVTIQLSRQYKVKPLWLPNATTLLILGCFIFGITRVYYYGNYNRYASSDSKQTMTKELTATIDQSNYDSQAPIIVNHPYMYFEAVNYQSNNHPVYYLKSQVFRADMIKVGSLAMLRDNTSHAIDDVNEFIQQHGYVWVIGNTTDQSATLNDSDSHWQNIITVGIPDGVSGQVGYKATLYGYNKNSTD